MTRSGAHIDPEDERLLAMRWLAIACDDGAGRPEQGDSVYRSIVEGRDWGDDYHSCADLAHWMLFRMGVRMPFINREEHLGWVCGKNLSRIAYCPTSEASTAMDQFKPGDILIIWNHPEGKDGHVCVVLETHPGGISTANADMPGTEYVESSLKPALDRFGARKWRLGHRLVQRWVSLPKLLEHAMKKGMLVPPEEPPR